MKDKQQEEISLQHSFLYRKKRMVIIVVLIFIIGSVSGCFFIFEKRTTIEKTMLTKRDDAELILKNLAVGMRMYSTITGGGGEVKFTGDITKIQNYIMQEAFAACNQKKPYHGYIVELTEYPADDNYKTNFRFVAKPALGYVGESYVIDKTEEIIQINNKEKQNEN